MADTEVLPPPVLVEDPLAKETPGSGVADQGGRRDGRPERPRREVEDTPDMTVEEAHKALNALPKVRWVEMKDGVAYDVGECSLRTCLVALIVLVRVRGLCSKVANVWGCWLLVEYRRLVFCRPSVSCAPWCRPVSVTQRCCWVTMIHSVYIRKWCCVLLSPSSRGFDR